MTDLLHPHTSNRMIQLECSSYTVSVQRGLLSDLSSWSSDLKQLKPQWAIITQDSLRSLYAESLQERLAQTGLKIGLFSIPAGEKYKTRETKETLENALFEQGWGQDSGVIALGGGVITDLAGFLAATFCRGIPFISIPTTLLAMVDASLGGKTGVNTPYGKNLVGCDYPPKQVLIDPLVLESLPKQELRNGLVEIIKKALIGNSDLFFFLETQARSLLNLEPALIDHVILESIQMKTTIVKQDSQDIGKRNLLNYGHTVGHALEHLSHYQLSHGEAVALGILMEGWIAMQLGSLTRSEWDRIFSLLKKCGLPLLWPIAISFESLWHAMLLDKKTQQAQPRFVILNGIGSTRSDPQYCAPISKAEVYDAFEGVRYALCSD